MKPPRQRAEPNCHARHVPTYSSRNSPKSLRGQRLLIAQCGPAHAPAIGSTLARAGAEIVITQGAEPALAAVRGSRRAFAGALVSCEFSPSEATEIVETLRSGLRPCLAVGMDEKVEACSARRLIRAGVIELVTPSMSASTLRQVMWRCASATEHLRKSIERTGHGPEGDLPSDADGHDHDASVDLGHEDSAGGPGIAEALDSLAESAGLTQREVSVLRMIVFGYRYREISLSLGLSTRTIKMHGASLRKKTGTQNRYDLLKTLYGELGACGTDG